MIRDKELLCWFKLVLMPVSCTSIQIMSCFTRFCMDLCHSYISVILILVLFIINVIPNW